ncbi:hypothetical protein [Paenibacillus sp. 481]|nr:hypothetical protein [Paenibacillus sp. 481]
MLLKKTTAYEQIIATWLPNRGAMDNGVDELQIASGKLRVTS